MTDLHEGRVRAWLDGELEGPEAETVAAHVERDAAGRAMAEALRAREDRTATLLGLLDTPPAPTARVRAVVARARARGTAGNGATGREARARTAGGGGNGSGRSSRISWARRSRLPQAAVLVLLLAGAGSAALPGSPVREWLGRVFGSDPVPTVVPSEVLEAPPTDEVGVAVAPEGGRVRIEIQGLPDGAEITVRLTDTGTVAVYAPRGSRFEREAGRIQTRAEAGPVRVEIPVDLASADLVVDGRVYLVKRGDRLDVEVTAAERSATEIRLRAGS